MASALPQPTDCCQTCCDDVTTVVDGTSGAPAVFDTKALLRADTGYFDDRYVIVLGDTVKYDGGGGSYVYDEDLTDADDGGTILKPNAIDSGDPGRYRQFTGA